MQRSWVVTAAVIVASAMLGLGAGVTTALVARSGERGVSVDTGELTGAGTPTDATSTMSASPRSSPAAPVDALYYVDGKIRDGQTEVAYRPRLQARVTNLSRTAAGWVVREQFGADGTRLTLVDHAGDATPIAVKDPQWYDVSPQGDAVAVPADDDPRRIDFVDPADGSLVSTLSVSIGAEVVKALFTGSGHDLVVLGDDAGGQGAATLVRYAAGSDSFQTLRPPPGVAPRLVAVDDSGTRLLIAYALGARQCVAVLDLDGNAAPLWKSCDYRPLGISGVSPDGSRVALAAASADRGTVTELSIVDADTGDLTGAVRISSGFRLIDVTWADVSHVVVQGANDAFTTETIDICSIRGGCHSVRGAGPDDPAEDVAPGS